MIGTRDKSDMVITILQPGTLLISGPVGRAHADKTTLNTVINIIEILPSGHVDLHN